MGFSSNSLPNMHLHFSLIIKVEIRSIHLKLIPTISTTSSFFFPSRIISWLLQLESLCILTARVFWSQLAPKLSVLFSRCEDPGVFDVCYRMCLLLS